MLSNYLLTTLRSFKRNVSYVFLNVLGLALGIGTSLVIYIVVSYELSYDRHHSNYDKIYRVTTVAELPEKTEYGAGLPHPFGDAVRADFPFVDKVVKMDYQWGGAFASFRQDQPLHKFHETEGLVFVSPEIFDVFTFRQIAGDLSKGISEPYGAAISDKWAEKYFDLPHERLQEAIGQVISVNSQLNVVINGVFEAPPKTTDFPFQLIVHYNNLEDLDVDFQEGKSWNNTNSTTNCYVVLHEGATPRQFTDSADSLMAKIYGKEEAERSDRLLQPLSDVHFNADFGNYGRVREKRWLYTVSIVGIFLLVAAAINFVNLATAQAGKRAREIGIRKVMGGHRRQLFTQFYIETLLVTVLAAFISLAIAEVLLILLSDVLGVRLYIEFSQRPDLLAFLIAVVAGVSAMAGIYPSMFLSGINVVQAIKSKSALHGAGRGASLRRLLVVFQFVISQVLIICTVVILLQLRYVQTKPLGFRKEAILIVGVPTPPASSFETLRERLLAVSGVEDVAFSMAEPLSGANSFSNFSYPAGGSTDDYMGNFKFIDSHFVGLFDLELLAGRNLRPQDSLHAAIINEKVAQMLGFGSAPDAVGAKIKTGVGGETEIVGVVKDFHLYTFHSGIGPTLLMYNPGAFYSAAIRFSSTDVSLSSANTAIGQIEGIWSETFPESMFQHAFLEDEIQRKYSSEKNLSTLLVVFSGIAIFIGALGLYGLVSFMANQRVKEIGVRKVLGASVFEIILVFNKEVAILIFSAFVISAPLAWWAMSRWLQDFAYQISLNGLILLTGVLLSVLIAAASTIYRTLAAAKANPVESLRSE